MPGPARGSETRILGIDFTSAPSRRKPITCLSARLEPRAGGTVLVAEELARWPDFPAFEAALARPGPWIAALDFPFGQARRFVANIGWPMEWAAYVAHVGRMDRTTFRAALERYRAPRPPGDREHRRIVDAATGAVSPQKLYGVPVALMFFEGAPRLLAAGVTVPGLHRGDPHRIAVEGYPGVLARALAGRTPYKAEARAKQTAARRDARAAILAAVQGPPLAARHGLTVDLPPALAEVMLADPGGDSLDALLCAIQVAWSWQRRGTGFGAPPGMDPLEGWIADPACGG